MVNCYVFTIHAYGKLHDGRRVTNVADSQATAYANVRAMYPGYYVCDCC